MFSLLSPRFDGIFEEKLKNVEMVSLKLGRKYELLAGDRLPFLCLLVSFFASFSLCTYSFTNHLPYRSCVTLLQELSGCLHQLKICCRKTVLIGTEGGREAEGVARYITFDGKMLANV